MLSPARTVERPGVSILVFEDAGSAGRAAAERIRSTVHAAVADRGRAVLGLATGATPQKVYSHLVALHREGALSFRDVVTYNVDEFYPIGPLDPKSYRSYMHQHLFSHVDLAPHHAHLLDGTVPEFFVAEHCTGFDRWIAADGGIDLQLLGIGRNGHIGLNEPSALALADALALPTRLSELHPVTRADAAREFGGEHRVIPRGLTMGVAPILAARSILMLATGAHKADVVARALNGPMTADLPASLLQSGAPRVTWMLDEPAAAGLF
ncbi:MAG: glucosamine-6-phosphate deaminase [Isosphaeraceae bacterium]